LNRLLQSLRTSRIVRKLAIRVLTIEAIGFVTILVLSFFFLWPLLNRQAAEAAADICVQMESRIELSINSIQTSSQFIISSRELKAALKDYYDAPSLKTYDLVRLTLSELQTSHMGIRGLILEGPDSTLFDSTIGLFDQDYDLLKQDWHQLARTNDYGSGFSILYEPNESATPSFAFSKSYLIGTDRYVLTLYYNASDMLNSIDALASNTFSAYALVDHTGLAFHTRGVTKPTVEEKWWGAVTSHRGMSISRNGGYFVISVPSSRWHLIAYADYFSLNRAFIRYFIITIVLFAMLCLLIFMLIIPMMHRAIKPLGQLSETMNSVKAGKLDTAVSILKTGDEIESLSDVFNDMLLRLKEHIDERIEHEQREQKMKFNLLASQVDPHFICNTMNIINYLARNDRSLDIIEINTALMILMQDRLRVDSIRVFDSVAQEVKAVKAYLIIQGYRYENNARIDFEIDDEALDMQIPKNIIQPLVENAMFHGLIDGETGEIRGNITVRIQTGNDGLIIKVQDDGKGIDTGRLKQIISGDTDPEEERGRHIGLRNIRERLNYLYDYNDCMEIESSGGTTVVLKIPHQ